MDRGAWQDTLHGVTKNDFVSTQSDTTEWLTHNNTRAVLGGGGQSGGPLGS